MRSLLLLCALAVAVILVCKPSERVEDLPVAKMVSTPVRAESPVAGAVATPAPRPSLLALLTLGTAVLGAVSSASAESPIDANAQLAMRIVDATAELEASAARVADHRVEEPTGQGSFATR